MNALTVDTIYRGGTAGQSEDGTVAAVDVLDRGATQRDVHVKAEENGDTQQSDDPGQGAAEVQPS